LAPQSSPPGTDVPRIAALRFDPDTIEAGGTTHMSFYFEVGSADLEQAFVVDRGIAQFQLFSRFEAMPINLKAYNGVVAGTAEFDLRWTTQGIRWIEVYVVSVKGNVSNRVFGTLTVR
jgi:hypothetical protein